MHNTLKEHRRYTRHIYYKKGKKRLKLKHDLLFQIVKSNEMINSSCQNSTNIFYHNNRKESKT